MGYSINEQFNLTISYKKLYMKELIFLNKIFLILIASTIFLFGCSNTLVAEFAIVKEVNEYSIVVENWGGETTEIVIPPANDVTFKKDKEYFINYEVDRSKKAVLVSAELSVE